MSESSSESSVPASAPDAEGPADQAEGGDVGHWRQRWWSGDEAGGEGAAPGTADTDAQGDAGVAVEQGTDEAAGE